MNGSKVPHVSFKAANITIIAIIILIIITRQLGWGVSRVSAEALKSIQPAAPNAQSEDPNIDFISACPGCHWVTLDAGPDGTVFTLTIDDPTTGAVPDFTMTATSMGGWVKYDFPDIELLPGFILSVSAGGPVLETMIISPLRVTQYDLAADTISGFATPGAQIHIWIWLGQGNVVPRYPVADSVTGAWTVDFSVPGALPEETIVDLLGSHDGGVSEDDANGNNNWLDWQVSTPRMSANSIWNSIGVYHWPPETLLTLSIDDPTNGAGVDKTAQATTSKSSTWTQLKTEAYFNLGGFDIQAGHILTVTWNHRTRLHDYQS